ATPYLGLFREEAERCFALMPAGQGVGKWPTARPSFSAVGHGKELTLANLANCGVMLLEGVGKINEPRRLPAGGRWCGSGAALGGAWRVVASGGALARGGAEPARPLGPNGYDALRTRSALFAQPD